MDLAQLQQQLPQLEYYCERLYNAQVRLAWRVYAPQGWQRRSEGNVACSCRIRMKGPKQSNRSPRLRNPRIIYLIYGCVRAVNAASLPASPPSERDHVHQSCCGVQTILDASHNPYAQYFASSSLLKMVSEQSVRCAVSKFCGPAVDLTAHRTHYQPVCRPEIKMEIRNYFLGYLQRYILHKCRDRDFQLRVCAHVWVHYWALGTHARGRMPEHPVRYILSTSPCFWHAARGQASWNTHICSIQLQLLLHG